MKQKLLKKIVTLLFVFSLTFSLSAQTNNTVDISDDVYTLLQTAESQGLCEPLASVRPYTERYIVYQLDKILENLQELEEETYTNEIPSFWQPRYPNIQRNIVEEFRHRFIREDGFSAKNLTYRISDPKGSIPISLTTDLSAEGLFSGGVYSDTSTNSFGYETWGSIHFYGDLGTNISYSSLAYLDITKMNLKKLGEYDIGWWWYDNYGDKNSFVRENHFSDRTINTYRNYAVLPYSYKKHWDGSIYYLKGGINSSGLKGWPFNAAGGFGMQGEIHGTFFEDLLDFGIGRYNREWAAMDTGSSLVLNANAHPFFGIDTSVKPFSWLSFSVLTGFLEFPNQNHINDNAWYTTDGNGTKDKSVKDSYFFHNLFSMAELDMDFRYFHFDFGSTVVYPNRFELGYSFPLIDRVVYQNNVGDYDNLALYSNLKLRYPGIGSIWGSLYIDEINAFFTDIFHNTRCMFAYQGGTKINIPWIPFGTLSFRYTKIEPYCYTHEALDPAANQPYYSHYISENYTNNGESLGYYLPPNSDELYVRFETKPLPALSSSFRYQLIRHGVDWGSGSDLYSGSSIYSELPAGQYGPGRNNLHKYFLRDGIYEWMNIFALEVSYDCNRFGLPIQVFGTVGYVHNWFTTIGNETPSTKTEFTKFSSSEYKENRGFVISLGIKAFAY